MSYSVKEIFKTLQGEGTLTGRVSVLCRFAGCNLWSGRETDRRDAICQFCDTDFVGVDGTSGGRYARPQDLARAVAKIWGDAWEYRFVVLTGGEPLLQVDESLLEALHEQGFEIAVETNGTIAVPNGLDWICVSPKGGTDLVVRAGHELKLVFPQTDAPPELYESLDFKRFSLQPMDGQDLSANTAAAIAYCMNHPRWQVSLQTHKYIGVR